MAVFSKSVYPSMVVIMPSVYKSRHFKMKIKKKRIALQKNDKKTKRKKSFLD